MRALTICQPYASLIVNPPHVKRVENRTWPTAYRGPLLIHAGKSRRWLEDFDDALPMPMPFSAVVGIARLAACVRIEDVPHLGPDVCWLSDHVHAEGPWCWVLTEAYRLLEPVPCPGALGLWAPSAEVAQAVEAQLANQRTESV